MTEYNKAGSDDGQPAQNTSSNQKLNSNSVLDAALVYAKRRWHVLPVHSVRNGHCTCGKFDCSSPGKHPRTKHGVKDASLDYEVIRDWWRRYPDANLGIATGGESRLIVVDIDPRRGGIDSLLRIEREHGVTPTFSVRTGSGGRHDYYRLPLSVRIGSPNPAGLASASEVIVIMWWPHLRCMPLASAMRSSTICRWHLRRLGCWTNTVRVNGSLDVSKVLTAIVPT